tara:strand:+ start:645 stop:842 length:198 start_codon:yes stop_codon:yes gene_type:complete
MVIVKGKLMLDYAYPCMMAEKALKNAHESMLNRDFDAAMESALIAVAESKLMMHAINDMKDRDRG